MKIKEIKNRPDIDQHKKLYASYSQFSTLLTALRAKELPNETTKSINDGIDRLNAVTGSEKELEKEVKNSH